MEDRGRRLLPTVVDQIAQRDPERTLFSIARTSNPAEGFLDVSAATFARAVNRASWYLEQHLGAGHEFPTIAYLGPQDLVYAILILASNKTGYKLLLNSPRNSLEAHLSIFEKTQCNTFLLPPDFALPVIPQILEKREMRVVEIPPQSHWLQDGEESFYPYEKTFEDARLEPFVVLHTSGSTGMPKPVVLKHGTVAAQDAFAALPSIGEPATYPALCAGSRQYVTFPLFHAAGVNFMLPASIFAGWTVVLGPSPPTPEIVNAVHLHGNIQYSALASMTIIELAKNAEYLENLSRIKLMSFGGGPLPPEVGDLVATKTRLMNSLGATETSIFPVSLPEPDDWAYMTISPQLGAEYRHSGGDLYEQFIVRQKTLDLYQGVFATFPELDEWPMKDLYSKHPTKANTWLYRGRSDDMIVFSTGEKLNPLEMEDTIGANQAVRSAIVSGTGRFQTSLLVEAVDSPETQGDKDQLIDRLWKSVQRANKASPTHARIHRNMIIFTSKDKPMLRAGKGTVQRKMTIDVYEKELDSLYKASDSSLVSSKTNGVPYTPGMVQDSVRLLLARTTDIDTHGLDPHANLFERGLDSLMVAELARELNGYLASHDKPQAMLPKTIYSNPTVAALTDFLSALLEGRSPAQSQETSEQKMQRLFDYHSMNLPISARLSQPHPGHYTVLLTGSTGSLGSYILDALVNDTQVSRIVCLNRSSDSLCRQQKSHQKRDLTTSFEKVHMLKANMAEPYFGLPIPTYRELLSEMTTIIHNAWKVDFNMDIDSFAPHVQGVRRLADFSAHSKFGAKLFFVSSIGAVSNYNAITGDFGQVPERIYDNWQIPQAMGYGESKFVSEAILDLASKEAGVLSVVCRVGQIAGPTRPAGMWPRTEWLPSLIESSCHLGKIPDSLGSHDTIDWLPVDLLGRAIVELAKHGKMEEADEQHGATVYHAVNPQHANWSSLLPTVVEYISKNRNSSVEVLSLNDWLEILQASAKASEDLNNNPAVKILGFYEELSTNATKPTLLETKNTLRAAPTLAKMEPVSNAWMETWLGQWEF